MATKNDEITEILKLIAPGTPIRDGLENILKAKTRRTYCSWRYKRSFRFSRWRF